MVDPHQTVPQEALNARLASLQDWMSRQGLASLVVFGRGHALGTATRSHGNLRFLANWDGDNADSALVVRSDDRPSLVVSNVFAAMRAREMARLREAAEAAARARAGPITKSVRKMAGGVHAAERALWDTAGFAEKKLRWMLGWSSKDAERATAAAAAAAAGGTG